MTSSATTTSIVPNTGTAFTFTIKSVTPLSTDKWEINFRLWNSPVKLTNVTLGFRKPFLWELEIRNPFAETGSTNEWNWTIQIWSIDDYRLWLTKTGSINMTLSSEIVVEEGDWVSFLTKVLAWEQWTDKLQIDEKSLTNTWSLRYTHTVTSPIIKFYIPFKARLNTSPQAEKMPEYPWIKVDKATISYTLWWKAVKYYISSEDPVWDTVGADSKVNVTANPPRPVTKQNSADFLWVRVIWGIQWGWNSEFTGQQQNISSIAPMNTRTAIRRNATLYITNMTSWQTVNGVKFVDLTKEANKNYPINWELAYETLIVKNGNVLINGKLNPDKKVLWIIVLKDAFNVTKDYNNVWNVYVTPNVSQINAIIYADGWFISVDNSWNPFEADSTARTQALKNQLLLNWSLFTRNTIWWAVPSIQTNGQYTLPWWAGTPYINIAIQYDLNYTRRWNVNCALAWWTKVEWWQTVCVYREPFIIRYDSRVQTTPPRLFAQ
jgi:hypothetical protein